MPILHRVAADDVVMLAPLNLMNPASDFKDPVIKLNSDVLPAPFGPKMPIASPDDTSKDVSSATTTAPKDFCKPETDNNGDITLAKQLQIATHRNFRSMGVIRDDQFDTFTRLLPLP